MAKKDFNNFSGLVRLTKDARLIAATNQEGTNAQLFFTGACNEGYQTKDGTDAVSFIEFRMNGKRATALAQYLTKGVSVIISRSRLRDTIFSIDFSTAICHVPPIILLPQQILHQPLQLHLLMHLRC